MLQISFWGYRRVAFGVESGTLLQMEMPETVMCFRPCSQAEFDLVETSGFSKWPPRLDIQPIFYPVTNLEYAREVNRWNLNHYGKGYVLKFAVRKSFLDTFEIQVVGASHQTEWWIPAEQMNEFNAAIIGKIEVVEMIERD